MDDLKILRNKIVSFEGLSFDDVLLLPNYSDTRRRDINLNTSLHPDIELKLPLISSPMDTVTEDAMAIAMAQSGGLGVIHRNLSIEKQIVMVKQVKKTRVTDKAKAATDKKGRLLVAAAVGSGKDLKERAEKLVSSEIDVILIDSGHGHSKSIIDILRYIKKTFPKKIVMAGNVSTYEGAKALVKEKADILRVGMGPGSICSTRVITGMGTPQVTAVREAMRATVGSRVTVIADGGIKQIGDIAKALGFGAKAVMLGSLLARLKESPGRVVTIKGKKYKAYRGMGSTTAMRKGSAERYGQERNEKRKLIPEGVEGFVPYKGKTSDFMHQVRGSLQSSFYYLGSKNLSEFFKKARFIRISSAGFAESHPHSIIVEDPGDNYLS
ncbi:hypothetical protein A3G67_04770 [Candidatus Roizmanbacteria bacterium RIFCSPLOWO2_12_FULL_40_12]|uniref:IMP dehydrogenase/GMP reductase domain-containing protein n=1 Tax=Candidatus Roizmanbacteria bacterium RIFCSPLOWO2_01_FULL_40_42 TaxID=1802066 RepID=A0A1F7J4L1_9BACT|nr:MAG: hypothetical protein A2779_04380 [Candidatus Roizmanbacteria bacterium RIFCSPHIGHO2_01_FULL_40_98]OGK27313.1 MAG: hypothetical protein A3C31_04705 [Candidatus Roizmanbacteria bacterium RIFCSPHIGHO2_02_FULL_40_53]OGK30815.1 MAG: hypothetical protein A2W49_02335 [Candidatus Roizmanbacteria bacterium RIFCSPHIGHO2_12_41_18]OGK36418.1 MAG: hypothetical protein A3E69_02330 [Candidatus Roizmanbacteria bacterium RIFCSPHIGHO2_12_FULL_40_130]OGK50546.1 MAG: hypothetical protein A3B50_02060 [Candi